MDYYVAIDSDGNVVGRYELNREPNIPDGFDVKTVDDISNYPIDKSVSWFP